jgi:hypothetical protein
MVGGGTAAITGLTRKQKKAEGEMIWKIRNDPAHTSPYSLPHQGSHFSLQFVIALEQ